MDTLIIVNQSPALLINFVLSLFDPSSIMCIYIHVTLVFVLVGP